MRKRVISFFMSIAMFLGILSTVALAGVMYDVSKNHWAHNYIEDLVSKGVINGYGDGTFRPDIKISREEAVKIIDVFYEGTIIDKNNKVDFLDIENRWSTKYIKSLVSANIIKGYRDKTFRPVNPITRGEVTAIITRVLDNTNLYEDKNINISYKDVPKGHWASKDIEKLSKMGIINGYSDSTFKPDTNITRAEFAKIVSSLPSSVDIDWDNIDETDTDEDGIYDVIEKMIGTDPNNPDTDGDGLSDGEEFYITYTNPLKKNSDNTGVSDFNIDPDGDGISNGEEIKLGTNPMEADSDFDGLTDSEEIELGTDPVKKDTDGDGASDGWEIENGYDPLKYNSFSVEKLAEEDGIKAKVAIKDGNGEQAELLRVESTKLDEYDEKIPGYIGTAFSFRTTGELYNPADISFELNSALFNKSNFKPVIYHLDKENGLLEEVETEVNGNILKTRTKDLSEYIVLNQKEFDEAWEKAYNDGSWDDHTDSVISNSKNDKMDIVFVTDFSQSMVDNDPQDIRIEVIKNLSDRFRNKKDRGAIVRFCSNAEIILNLTEDINELKSKAELIGNNGWGTNGADGIKKAIEVLEKSDFQNNQYIVFLTDGEDNYCTNSSYDQLIEKARVRGIKIFTVGLGADIDTTNLQRIAIETGGKYYHSNIAKDLNRIYGIIGNETIDTSALKKALDSNGDGIADYYSEKLVSGKLLDGFNRELSALYSEKDIQKLISSDDADNDGLKNGEEIKIEIDKNTDELIFKFKSDPFNSDTDGDGIKDGDEKTDRVNTWDVSDYDMVLFSDLAYSNRITRYPEKIKLKDAFTGSSLYRKHKENRNLDEWEIIDNISEKYYGERFDAVAFKKGNTVVIAYRGTDGEFWNGVEWGSNYDTARKMRDHVSTNYARYFAKKVYDEYIKDEQILCITGHSLGGHLALQATYGLWDNLPWEDEITEHPKKIRGKIDRVSTFNGLGMNLHGFGTSKHVNKKYKKYISLAEGRRNLCFKDLQDTIYHHYIDGDPVYNLSKTILKGKEVRYYNTRKEGEKKYTKGMQGEKHKIYHFIEDTFANEHPLNVIERRNAQYQY